MATFDTFPDAEALASKVLRDASITGLSTRVYSSIPNDPTWPLVTVKRIGGVPVERHRLDHPRIQIDVWGTSKSEALDIAQAARAALHAMEGQSYSSPVTGTVTAVRDDLGLTWSPDPVTNRDRYIFGVSLTTHA
jgi:hypothetical protein